ncbi:Hypothetical protein NTJ_00966 [Nesidiocoris tenuis]|uniref:Uncharacterized protein n=1 Tax=Nesidiocoris tenuis TaxID=355587 RepID=A0ABN7A7N0_9HEMI|nr:Hypothetical protein NTJ_00966 [Nesidiocoris tenuis]
MDVKDYFKSLPKTVRTKGTKFYRIRNYIVWSVTAVGLLIGGAIHFSKAGQMSLEMINKNEAIATVLGDKQQKVLVMGLPNSMLPKKIVSEEVEIVDGF